MRIRADVRQLRAHRRRLRLSPELSGHRIYLWHYPLPIDRHFTQACKEETWVLGYFGFSARCQRYPTTPTAATMITDKVRPFRCNHEPTEFAKIPIPTANKRAIRGLPEKPRGFGSVVSNMVFSLGAQLGRKILTVAHRNSQLSLMGRDFSRSIPS